MLVDTTMPDKYQLPRSLRGIFAKNAIEVRQTTFGRDVAELIKEIEKGPAEPSLDAAAAEVEAPRPVLSQRKARTITVPKPDDGHYDDVVDEMLDGWVVVFLGSSVRGSLPDSTYLARSLAHQYSLHLDSSDLAEVAQRVLLTEGEDKLYGSIKQILAAASKPMAVHRFLAEFPRLLRQQASAPAPQLIISTNYDWALERAFEDSNEPFDYAVYMANSARFVHYPWGNTDTEPKAIPIDAPREYAGFPIDDDVYRTVIVKVRRLR